MTSRRATLLLLLCLPVALAGCEEEKVAEEIVRPVFAIKVGDVSSLVKTNFPGRAKASGEVNLSFRVAGPLIARPANVGDQVKRGDVLARIDPRDFEVALQNAEGQLERERARLVRAQADFERIVQIRRTDPGAASEAALDQVRQVRDSARASIKAFEAQVAAASDDLGYTNLIAPYDGLIVSTYVENFEYVQAQQPILRLLDNSSVEFTIYVPESLIGYAPYVQSVKVQFDALPGVEVEGKVKEISKEASQATRTYPVVLRMPQPEGAEILPGMAGKASIAAKLPESAKEVGINVPATAVFSPDDTGKSYVWVLNEGSKTLSRREVQVDRLTAFGVLVKSGLEAGEWIVFKGVNSLRDGQKVTLIAAKSGGAS
ncbi:MAG: efflux RND transporter periplasmic adaptor subunit [Alphaproteobacteria bacterium]|nr:efflux RND transporter periplasmic adaptor subunit [Alphaproteobacteria bacterium]